MNPLQKVFCVFLETVSVLFSSAVCVVKVRFHGNHIEIQIMERLIKCRSLNIMIRSSETILEFH